MTISDESLEIILDLIEIKMNALQIPDSDDVREVNKLRKCKQEFLSLINQINPNSLKKNTKEISSSEKASLRNS
jgi:hypothetical protein